jgi:gluconate 5-dehydrogenase
MVPEGADGEGFLEPEIMVPPLRWLCSDDAAGVHDERLVAAEFDTWLAARKRGNV